MEGYMKKAELNFAIDLAALAAFILLLSTGFLIYFVLPAGSGQLEIWGLNRHGWGEIHFWIAISFLLIIGIHFVLHWKWIKNMSAGSRKQCGSKNTRITALILMLVVILILAVSPYFAEIESSGEKGHKNQDASRVELVE